MSKIIAVANEKGGVAKTTTAISLGGAFVLAGKSVLLVDMDPQASLTIYFGFYPSESFTSTADILINSAVPKVLSTGIPRLNIIPASRDLSLADRFLTVRKDSIKILKEALSSFRDFDVIIIDCPPSLGITTQNALVAADLLITPVTPEYLAVNTLRTIFQLIRSIRSTENPTLVYRILFTIVDKRIRSHLTISSRFRDKFPSAVLKTQIRVDTRIRDASMIGVPVMMYAPKTRSALEYQSLITEITPELGDDSNSSNTMKTA